MSQLALGLDFAGCRVEEVIGRGGMGVIYRGTDLQLGRPVAIKLIAAEHATDASVRRRFEREARLMAAIDHPNVIPVYAAGEQDGHLYLVMRYVPGTDLQAVLRERGRLAPPEAARIVGQVADALDAAHASGLVHRDIKPANVLIAGSHAYLTDFGITRAVESRTRITDSNEWVGTVDFMSPEHLRGGHVDVRSDVYSLGCLLFACLTGSPPFWRETAPATILAHLTEPSPSASGCAGVPRRFDAVIGCALAKKPADRYQSAGELGRAAMAAADVQWFSTRRRRRGAAVAPIAAVCAPPRRPWDGARASGTMPGRDDHAVASSTSGAEGGGVDGVVPGGEDGAVTGVVPGREGEGVTGVVPGREGEGVTGVLPGGEGEGVTGVLPGGDEPEVRIRRRPPEASATAHQRTHLFRTRVWRTLSTRRVHGVRSSKSAKRGVRRRRRLGALAAVTALLLALAAVAISAGGTTANGPLSTSDVTGAAQAFATAYGHRDAHALSQVLATDVARITPTVVEHGRVAVLNEYLQQFQHTAIRGYELHPMEVTPGWVGRLAAHYTVPLAGGGALTGEVVFGVLRSNGRAVIALITTQPAG